MVKRDIADRSFIPARPHPFVIGAARALISTDLALNNKLYVERGDLEVFRKLPPGSGLILAANHADETDPLVCLELARRSKLQLITMCNREAFDEDFGIAGWILQRLGYFSVKRGAHDGQAKTYAIDVVKSGQQALLIFPEGEIYYLNEEVQPFHSGAIDISLRALAERRKLEPNWSAFIVPMVIKYHYHRPIDHKLEERVQRIERDLKLEPAERSLPERLVTIQNTLLGTEALKHKIELHLASRQKLTQAINTLERKLVEEVDRRWGHSPPSETRALIDQAFALAAELNEQLEKEMDQTRRKQLQEDLQLLRQAEQLSSWRPHYYLDHATPDRLAEAVLKLERQLYNIKRPRQLARRDVYLKIAEPLDMSVHLDDFESDPHLVHQRVTHELHNLIQSEIDRLAERTGQRPAL